MQTYIGAIMQLNIEKILSNILEKAILEDGLEFTYPFPEAEVIRLTRQLKVHKDKLSKRYRTLELGVLLKNLKITRSGDRIKISHPDNSTRIHYLYNALSLDIINRKKVLQLSGNTAIINSTPLKEFNNFLDN
jgi:hypothetical protein